MVGEKFRNQTKKSQNTQNTKKCVKRSSVTNKEDFSKQREQGYTCSSQPYTRSQIGEPYKKICRNESCQNGGFDFVKNTS